MLFQFSNIMRITILRVFLFAIVFVHRAYEIDRFNFEIYIDDYIIRFAIFYHNHLLYLTHSFLESSLTLKTIVKTKSRLLRIILKSCKYLEVS